MLWNRSFAYCSHMGQNGAVNARTSPTKCVPSVLPPHNHQCAQPIAGHWLLWPGGQATTCYPIPEEGRTYVSEWTGRV